MIRHLVFALLGLTCLDHAALVQAQAPARAAVTSVLTVTVPTADTEVEIDGQAIAGTGISRRFETAPLPPDRSYQYTVTAKWRPNTYTNMRRTKVVTFRAGEQLNVDLTVDDPSDRVVVTYVPTPGYIAAEMVKLAGVTAADVSYEPGCGDARITIAAVKGGARWASISIPRASRSHAPTWPRPG